MRLALLEADVALPVVKTFIERIRERAVGEEVAKSLTPGQALVKIIHSELVAILGERHAPIDLQVTAAGRSYCWRGCKARARRRRLQSSPSG